MNKIIILSVTTFALLSFSGCGDKKDESTKSVVEVAKEAAAKTVDAAKDAASAAVDKTKEAAAATTEAVKEKAAEATEAAKETVSKAAEATKEAAAKTVDAAKDAASAAVDKTKEAAAATTEAVKEKAAEAKEAVAGGNEKGKSVYAKCVSCHGADGKTKALGKSEIIAGQAAADLEKKLQEYKAGTRNVAGMGMLMKGQVAPLSDEDIKAVAEYISSLK